MRLSTLLQDIYPLPLEVDKEVAYLVLDSRKIKPQDVFIALPGSRLDGRKYVADAIARGAAAVLVEAQPPAALTWQNNIPLIPVQHLAQQLGALAARFYDYPADHLRVIGVTGTSGKTSCTHFIAQSLQAAGVTC